MSRRSAHKKGISPVAATLLLLVCGGGAFWSLRHHFGGSTPADTDASTDAGAIDAEPEGDGSLDAEPVGVDLLARHGSFDRTGAVRMAFANPADAALAAAPLAETAAPAAVRWVGADPPPLRLGVVMVGDAVRRAVIDGAVVGVGDTVGRTTVVAIQRDIVTVAWGTRRLTYDLESEYPREFRAELQRRAAAGAGTTTEPKQRQEGP